MSNSLPLLETARLTLRPFRSADIDALHFLWTDPGVRRYLWDDVIISRQQTGQILARALDSADKEGIGMWSVMLREYIGFCGLRHIAETSRIEILFALYPAFQGKGFGFEAARAIIDYAFESGLAERVYGRADEANVASIRLLQKLGMRLEEKTIVGGNPTLVLALDKPAIAQQ